jgi:hypothetical protein
MIFHLQPTSLSPFYIILQRFGQTGSILCVSFIYYIKKDFKDFKDLKVLLGSAARLRHE